MVNSVVDDTSTATTAASKPKEVALPVYADDLPDNVRDGFDKTCVYIKDCTDALEERLNSKFEAITSRLDALTDNLVNPRVQVEPPAAAVASLHGRDDPAFEDDAGYAAR